MVVRKTNLVSMVGTVSMVGANCFTLCESIDTRLAFTSVWQNLAMVLEDFWQNFSIHLLCFVSILHFDGLFIPIKCRQPGIAVVESFMIWNDSKCYAISKLSLKL